MNSLYFFWQAMIWNTTSFLQLQDFLPGGGKNYL
jgi:hypothetical protein